MATDERNVVFVQTTDAEFRTWVAACIAQLIAIGLTQTSDTGQIDTATVAKPAGANQTQGYAIFRFNDTLQATAPIFLKVEFGSGGGGSTMPSIFLTCTSSTNGAGTMTGLSYRARTQLDMATGNATSWPIKACYNAAIGMAWLHWHNSGVISGGVAFGAIARTCGPLTGAPNGQGVYTAFSIGAMQGRVYDIAGAIQETSPVLCAFPVAQGSSETVAMDSGRMYALPSVYVMKATGYATIFPGLITYYFRHLPQYHLCYATPAGTEYRYLTLGEVSPYTISNNGSSNERAMLIWE